MCESSTWVLSQNDKNTSRPNYVQYVHKSECKYYINVYTFSCPVACGASKFDQQVHDCDASEVQRSTVVTVMVQS